MAPNHHVMVLYLVRVYRVRVRVRVGGRLFLTTAWG